MAKTALFSKVIRCAVYTRKSSEEGLDQAFNSLDAQREACEAYIKSQVGEGWRCLPHAYDDGGISGGTMARSGLQRLLADIERGMVDCVVVYKVDRLTRSLTDFAKIIDVLDRSDASFVSVTQAFNTTTSMGRLTLNVLLSFAQFEREVTGERIRDKIAASKKKGMWMGGMPPLGYDIPKDRASRALVVNEIEAEVVRDIYRRYLRLKSVNQVRDELARDGVRSKSWISAKGRPMGGAIFNAGSLFHLLQSRVYRGEIVHGEESYPGAHEAIVDADLFDAVQTQLSANMGARDAGPNAPSTLPLKGLVFDAEGHAMGPTYSYSKAGKRHAYYVSSPLKKAVKLSPSTIGRISAAALEGVVLDRLRRVCDQPLAAWSELLPTLVRVDVEAQCLRLELDRKRTIGDDAAFNIHRRLDQADRVEFETGNGHTFQVIVALRPVFRGGRTWLVRPDGARAMVNSTPDRQLVSALAQAHVGLTVHQAAPSMSPQQWQRATSVPDSYLRRLVRFAFLAPDIQRAILDGRQPAGLTAYQILEQGVPLAWADQRAAFGFAR